LLQLRHRPDPGGDARAATSHPDDTGPAAPAAHPAPGIRLNDSGLATTAGHSVDSFSVVNGTPTRRLVRLPAAADTAVAAAGTAYGVGANNPGADTATFPPAIRPASASDAPEQLTAASVPGLADGGHVADNR